MVWKVYGTEKKKSAATMGLVNFKSDPGVSVVVIFHGVTVEFLLTIHILLRSL